MSDRKKGAIGTDKPSGVKEQAAGKKMTNARFGLILVIVVLALMYVCRVKPDKMYYPFFSDVNIEIPEGAPEDFKRLRAELVKDVSDLPPPERPQQVRQHRPAGARGRDLSGGREGLLAAGQVS